MPSEIEPQRAEPLFEFSAAAIAPFIFTAGLAFGALLSVRDGNISHSLADWLAITATLAIVAMVFAMTKKLHQLGAAQALHARTLRQESVRPQIALSIEGNVNGQNILKIRIENRGNGPARHVRFTIHDRAGRMMAPGEHPLADKLFKIDPFRQGLEILGVNHRIEHLLITPEKVQKGAAARGFDAFLCVKCSVQDSDGGVHGSDYIIDLSDIASSREIEKSPLQAIERDLRQMRMRLESMPLDSNAAVTALRSPSAGASGREKTAPKMDHAEMLRWIEEQRSKALAEQTPSQAPVLATARARLQVKAQRARRL